MTTKPQKRLGRGLDSLISLTTSSPIEQFPRGPEITAAGQPLAISIDLIHPNPLQPRTHIQPDDLQALASSIRTAGLIQPIIVRPKGESAYEIIAGERRWRAAKAAGLAEIPAVVRDATDEQMLEIALIENIFREDLNAIDRAQAYRRYCEQFGLSADEVAGRLGEDRSTVANYLRLLDLPPEAKEWVASGKLAMGHARCLLAIKSVSDLLATARRAMSEDLSVRALEKLVRERVAARAAAGDQPAPERAKRPQIRHLEQAFMGALGTKVEIRESRRKGSGKIVIQYFSLEDFDRIAERLGIEAH